MTDLYSDYDYDAQEIALLREHDEGETLHAFIPGDNITNEDYYCGECGDTAEGLMHNNTWRNVEPLIDLDACNNGCVCE